MFSFLPHSDISYDGCFRAWSEPLIRILVEGIRLGKKRNWQNMHVGKRSVVNQIIYLFYQSNLQKSPPNSFITSFCHNYVIIWVLFIIALCVCSETRLLEIVEAACEKSDFDCNKLLEQIEDQVETWWFRR